jgi:hypothetical protein
MDLLASQSWLGRPHVVRGEREMCIRCGHRHQDHHEGDVCLVCDSGPAGSACGLFALYGFVEPGSNALDWTAILN